MTEAYPLPFSPGHLHAGHHGRKARALWARMSAAAEGGSPASPDAADDAGEHADGRRGGPHRGHRGGHRRGPGGRGDWGGRGPWGPPRGRRRDRGDVLHAILLLLAEQPRHGYEILTEIADRSDGRWQPSPGSVYPVLKRLAHDELVAPSNVEGKRVFALTEAGRALVETEGPSWGEPWARPEDDDQDAAGALWQEGRLLGGAVRQVSQLNDPAQLAATTAILVEARKRIYALLAE